MRVVTFPKDEKEARGLFGILNTVATQGHGEKDHAKNRTLGKIHDLFEELSHMEDAENEDGDGTKTRVPVLNKGVKSITMDDAYVDLLKERVFGREIDWLPSASRRVTAVYDLLNSAESVSPAEKSEKPAKKGRKK